MNQTNNKLWWHFFESFVKLSCSRHSSRWWWFSCTEERSHSLFQFVLKILTLWKMYEYWECMTIPCWWWTTGQNGQKVLRMYKYWVWHQDSYCCFTFSFNAPKRVWVVDYWLESIENVWWYHVSGGLLVRECMSIEDCRGLVRTQRHHQQCKKMMMMTMVIIMRKMVVIMMSMVKAGDKNLVVMGPL